MNEGDAKDWRFSMSERTSLNHLLLLKNYIL